MPKPKRIAPYSTLDTVSNEKETTGKNRIVVRIIHTWEVRDFRRNNLLLSVECLLLDENDCAIQASILPTRLAKFKDLLIRGNLYAISDFDVVAASNRYRRTNHKWRIVFTDRTYLDSVLERQCSIGFDYFRLSTFNELLDLGDKGEELPDIVAQISSYRTSENKEQANPSKTTFNIVLTCIFGSGDTAYVSLWDKIATDTHAELITLKDQTVVLIATHVNPRKVGRHLYLNGTSSTQMFLNPNNDIVHQFSQSDYFKKSVAPSILVGRTELDPNDLYMIDQIENYVKEQSGQVKTFWCKVKVVDVVLRNGWNYISCTTCNLKMKKMGSSLTCVTCTPSQVVGILRYRIEIIVDDGHNTTNFVILDEEATQLFKRSASTLVEEKANFDELADQPPQLIKDLIGKSFYFNVKVSSFNYTATFQSFTVTSIKDYNDNLPSDVPNTQLTTDGGNTNRKITSVRRSQIVYSESEDDTTVNEEDRKSNLPSQITATSGRPLRRLRPNSSSDAIKKTHRPEEDEEGDDNDDTQIEDSAISGRTKRKRRPNRKYDELHDLPVSTSMKTPTTRRSLQKQNLSAESEDETTLKELKKSTRNRKSKRQVIDEHLDDD